MSNDKKEIETKVCWFVGANFDRTNDQTPRFIKEGIWEIRNPGEKEIAFVKSMQPGDPIAIKSAYVRKHNLPFDNHGNTVSVMAIKAVGTVKDNPGNGFSVLVDWNSVDPVKEWYFYTYRSTIWRVLPGDWAADGLIEFAFEGKEQDIDRFRNHPYWKERFGDRSIDKRRFDWTRFYESFAEKLLLYRNKRSELITKLHELSTYIESLSILNDEFEKGVKSPLEDICPFTVIGLFNRGITDENRIAIASELGKFLEIEEAVPNSFDGIPVLNNQNTWLFGYAYKRQDDDIEALWEVFSKALEFSDSNDQDSRHEFINAYNDTIGRYMVGWKLTMGLYWIRPWSFPTLDSQSQRYITKKLNIQIGMNGPKGRCNAEDYLTVLDTLETRFKEDGYPVHSFPELSLAAWHFKDIEEPHKTDENSSNMENGDDTDAIDKPVTSIEPYSLDSILKDGCFVERERLKTILERLRTKKNLILQGPPGTGKTWLAKRLAFALMGERDESKLRAVQFHPNLSYEDFIRGWRPMGEGKLTLVDGPFLEMMTSASKEPASKHVVVIEEINRGNPAQIFGEMLTLLEVDKRTPNEALELSYRRSDDERLFIPGNLYVIGTMNIADRSLALVDLALRRRFAFIDLEPALGKLWRDWVQSQCGIASEILIEIEKRIVSLNNEISADAGLGPQFRIGHSYVTPPFGIPINDAKEWFHQVVETEIGPLLDEYWFDGLEKARKAKDRLLEGF